MSTPRVSDLEDCLPAAVGGAPLPTPRDPQFALIAAAGGFQFALDHVDPCALMICSSVDAAELEDRVAIQPPPKANRRPAKRRIPFPIYGMGVRDMTFLSAPQINSSGLPEAAGRKASIGH
jgi:hypothetical protein